MWGVFNASLPLLTQHYCVYSNKDADIFSSPSIPPSLTCLCKSRYTCAHMKCLIMSQLPSTSGRHDGTSSWLLSSPSPWKGLRVLPPVLSVSCALLLTRLLASYVFKQVDIHDALWDHVAVITPRCEPCSRWPLSGRQTYPPVSSATVCQQLTSCLMDVHPRRTWALSASAL